MLHAQKEKEKKKTSLRFSAIITGASRGGGLELNSTAVAAPADRLACYSASTMCWMPGRILCTGCQMVLPQLWIVLSQLWPW